MMEMTMQLVKKDFIHLTHSLRSLLMSWSVICIFLPLVNLGIALAMPALGAYLIFFSMMSYEEKNKGNLLTSTLPVRRESMCMAQYIETFIYIVVGIIFSHIGLGLKGLVDPVKLSLLVSVSWMFSIGLIYVSIILPCVFYFGTIKTKTVLVITYGAVFGGLTALNIGANQKAVLTLQNMSSGVSGFMMLAIAILIWITSYFISLRIFKNKDFK